jgi:DNA repair exonuclease SbcCD nuclease subunit|tara:strand:- start:1604 stop:2626 length:1023 start_codon:yes stop_codon:yes gene_type:complete
MPLFKKAACFTDIHFGMKGGSRTHNNDCEEFVKWFCKEAKAAGAETCIFLGDWHHNRATTDVSTMNYTVSNLERLNETFEKVYFMVGNHDLFYKDKREINSIEFMRLFPNIIPITEIYTEGEVTMLPWLIGEEWKTVPKIQSRYIFGHFELPLFYMNALVQMPDHGTLQAEHFINQEYVFSGHFHKRQTKGNVTYMGNAFPHNYADAWDDDRGMMFLDWGGTPEYKTWPKQPVFRTFKLSQLLEDPDNSLSENMHCRVTIDVPISFEEANFIRETFIPQYNLRELMLIPEKVEVDSNVDPIDLTFESVDTIVLNQIEAIDSDTIDKRMLMEIYRDLGRNL